MTVKRQSFDPPVPDCPHSREEKEIRYSPYVERFREAQRTHSPGGGEGKQS